MYLDNFFYLICSQGKRGQNLSELLLTKTKIMLLEEFDFLYILLEVTPTESARLCLKTQGNIYWTTF